MFPFCGHGQCSRGGAGALRRFGTQRGHQYGVSAPEAVTRTVVRRQSWRGKGVLKCGMAESS